MVDFSNVKSVWDKKPRDYELVGIKLSGRIPILNVCPATKANPRYLNAFLKRSGRTIRRVQAQNIDIETLDINIKIDKDLYVNYGVVVGWDNVYDAKGEAVDFTKAVCKEFFDNLPDITFEELRIYCANDYNFIDCDDKLEIEDVAKN